MPEELFYKKDIVGKEKVKRVLTDKQITAIRKESTLKYFKAKWKEKYGLEYIIPPRGWTSIDMPLQDAIKANYTLEMLCKGIDAYLACDFQGYTDQSHPIKFFTGNISKWVLEADKMKKKIEVQKSDISPEEIRQLNEQYGLVYRLGNWLSEDGKMFTDKAQAIAYCQKGKN